jgi:hypothetical protein
LQEPRQSRIQQNQTRIETLQKAGALTSENTRQNSKGPKCQECIRNPCLTLPSSLYIVCIHDYSCIFTAPPSLPACSTSSPNMLAPPISTHFCGNKLVSTSQSRPSTKLQTRTQHEPNINPATREKNRSTRDVFGKRDVVDPRSIAKLRWMLTDCIAASIHVRLTFAKLRCLNLAGQMFDPACHVDHQSWTETCRRGGIDSFAGYHGYLPEPCAPG